MPWGLTGGAGSVKKADGGQWGVSGRLGRGLRAGALGGDLPYHALQRGEVERVRHGRHADLLEQGGRVWGEGVARGEDEARHELRAVAAQALDELAAGHPRHADVGDDHVEVALFERAERLGAVAHPLALDAAPPQEPEQGVPQRRLVVDDQDREGAHGGLRRRGRLGYRPTLLPRVAGDGDDECRSLSGLRLDPDAPTVLLRDAVANREAEARPEALGLGGEERVEDAAADVGADPGA